MFGPIGGPELILILVLALLLFGPRKLPQIGRSIGKALAEFRGVTNEFRSTLEREVEVEELRKTQRELKQVGQEVDSAVREVSHGVARDSIADAPGRRGASRTDEVLAARDAADTTAEKTDKAPAAASADGSESDKH